MCREAARVQLKVPFRWTAMTASHSASVMLKIIRSRRMPATLTRMSIRPKVRTTCSTIWVASSNEATLPRLTSAVPPVVRISSTTWSAGSDSAPSPDRLVPRSLTTTFAPAWASARAMPRPMPRPAPVTSAAFPSSIRIRRAYSPGRLTWRDEGATLRLVACTAPGTDRSGGRGRRPARPGSVAGGPGRGRPTRRRRCRR